MTYMLAAALMLASGGVLPAADTAVVGDYVEARTAEVYTGGCIMGSEGEVAGREALMAWRVREGSFQGVALGGLSIVALVAGDVNLSTHEMGGVAPTDIKAMVMVDERATPAQQRALVAMVRSLAPGVVREAASTRPAAIRFDASDHMVHLTAGAASLEVERHVEHKPECGAARWYEPLARVENPQVGLTRTFEWSGDGLGAQWRQLNRNSAYVGSFTVGR